MLIAKNLGLEDVVIIADMYVRDDKRYLMVSYKEYAELRKQHPEVPNSGPEYWDNLFKRTPEIEVEDTP